MSIALPQKLLSWRVSENTRSPGSPPARKPVRLPLPPLQPAPPKPRDCWKPVLVGGWPTLGTIGCVWIVPRQFTSPWVAIVPPPPPEPPPELL